MDFIEGLATAITPLAMLDVVMIKGFRTLVDDDTVVDYRDGVAAALKLHELTRKDAGVVEAAEIMARQNRIIAAMREMVPERYHDAIMARIDGKELPPAPLDVEEEEDDDDDIHET